MAVHDRHQDEARTRSPDMRRGRGSSDPDRLQEDAGRVDSADGMPLDQRAGREAPDCETETDAAEDEAVAEVSGVEGILRKEDLRGLDRRDRAERDRPDDEHGQQRSRAHDDRESVAKVAEMAGTGRYPAL